MIFGNILQVYQGVLPTGQMVAIKRAKRESMQGAPEFKVEVELLSRVHHKNLVSLVGFCLEHGEQMLVYEFVPNGDLRDTLSGIPCIFSLYKAYDIKGNIFSDNRNTFLSWYRQVRNQVGLDEKT